MHARTHAHTHTMYVSIQQLLITHTKKRPKHICYVSTISYNSMSNITDFKL